MDDKPLPPPGRIVSEFGEWSKSDIWGAICAVLLGIAYIAFLIWIK
jgi:hypothetical protein